MLHKDIEKRQRQKRQRWGEMDRKSIQKKKDRETATQKRQKEMEKTRERKTGRETTDKTGKISFISFPNF